MRAFVFGVLLVACGGGEAAETGEPVGAGGRPAAAALAGAPSSAAAGAAAQADAGGAGAVVAAAVCEPGRSEACACTDGSVGAQACASDALSWKDCVCVGGANSGGSNGVSGSAGATTVTVGGASSAGSGVGGAPATAAGAPGVAGAASVAGSGGAAGFTGDPLAPFEAPGCPGFTAYRVPQGSFLAVTSGNFEANSLKNGVCTPIQGEPSYQRCGVVSNVDQCVCTVASPSTCGQYCDGGYVVTVIRAKPGDTLQVALHDGQGACVAGVPTKVDG